MNYTDSRTGGEMPARTANKKKSRKNVTVTMAFFTVAFFWQEIFTRLFTFGDMTFFQFLLVTVQCITYGMFFSLIISFIGNKKALKITMGVISGFTSLIYAAQIVYYKVFRQYFAWETVGMAGQLKDYIGEALLAILTSIPKIAVIAVPLIAFFVLKDRYTKYKKVPNYIKVRALIAFVLALLLGLILRLSNAEAKEAYKGGEVNITSQYFGVLTSSKVGIHYSIFGSNEDLPGDETDPGEIVIPPTTDTEGEDTKDPDESGTDEPERPIVYGDNVLDIDFDALIEKNKDDDTIVSLLKYFKGQSPTKKNKYTGYFEGKNLIFISLESFCGEFVTKEFTPTLYEMMHSGFVFNNYYCSCWGGSTATGEYANLSGMFYNKATALKLSGGISLPFALGNQLMNKGYNTFAFHANSYDYYNRELGYPAFGYQTYYGKGGTVLLDPKTRQTTILDKGIEEFTYKDGSSWSLKSNGKSLWPESDYELAKLTVSKYIDAQPFHVYYMSISGHCNYNWSGNSMCIKHQNEVENLGYKLDEVKAYVAGEIEVELMLKELMRQLEEGGALDNTVFVLAPDHFPYEMSADSLSELYGLPADGITKNYELYKNNLIIWCKSMEETVTVDTPCSAIDILPTVSNLFGLDYDSRLMAGTDVLSGSDPIVVMNCVSGPYWGWITRAGYYESSKFYPADNIDWDAAGTTPSAYSKNITKRVTNMQKYYMSILKNDFFRYLELK